MNASADRAAGRIAAAGLVVGAALGLAGTLVTSARLFAGAAVGPLASPLPFFAYPFLVATLLGWAWVAARKAS
jgi:hypothetical protein